jgi:hypothetical protein
VVWRDSSDPAIRSGIAQVALHRARVTVDDRPDSLLASSDAVLQQRLLSCEDGSSYCAHEDQAGQPSLACIVGSDHRRITRDRLLVIPERLRNYRNPFSECFEVNFGNYATVPELPLRGVAAAHHRQDLAVCHLAGHEHSAIRTIFHGPV